MRVEACFSDFRHQTAEGSYEGAPVSDSCCCCPQTDRQTAMSEKGDGGLLLQSVDKAMQGTGWRRLVG